MVNWCPVSLTALSDEEVIMKPTKGSIYQVRYELVNQPGRYIEVKTTRPETIPGDVAIAGNLYTINLANGTATLVGAIRLPGGKPLRGQAEFERSRPGGKSRQLLTRVIRLFDLGFFCF